MTRKKFTGNVLKMLHMPVSRLAASLVVLSLAVPALYAQQPFTPTPAQQADIDKDNARHFGDTPADPGPLAKDLSPALTPAAVDAVTRKVADWQLSRAQPFFDRIWTWSVLYSGFMAASESTGDPKYREAMLGMGRKFNFELRNRLPNADDQSVGQTYLELFLAAGKKDRAMIAPTQADLDSVIGLDTLRPGDPKIPWWWCDSLFMAPPLWARMAAATGDNKYIVYLDRQWQRTYDALWDKQEHLYARDETYLSKREANGKKVFWSRGEGWVFGGLVRTLQFLPKDDPRRDFYLQQLRDMSARIVPLQRADGLWPAGLLDSEHYPEAEVSGSALFVYGMAWGVNEGVLDAKTYTPVIQRAWTGMVTRHIYADGRLGNIQQTGPEPAYFPPSASYTYGVGGFLLAASELKRMSLHPGINAQAMAEPGSPTDPAAHARLNLPTPFNPALPTLFLVGDSTVRNGRGDGANNQMGWGEPLVAFFDPSKLNVVNRAIGGRSSRTYITEGHWADTLALIKPGDVVLFQFGHNDSGPLDDTSRARGSLPGTGPDSREIENPILHRHETVHTFGWYMARYVADTVAKGATPILCSPIPRKIWKDGHIVRNESTYGGWAREVAATNHALFIDLDEIISRRYDALGEAAVEPLFGDPHTHTTLAGATLNAEAVVAGLKSLPHDPVAAFFSAKAQSIQPADNATPQPISGGTVPALNGIAHVAIRVHDLAASAHFYESLGFEKAFELSRDGTVYETFIKINDRQFLELYSVSAREPQVGFLHLCFEGADLDAIHNDYIAEGLKPIDVRKAGAGNLLFTLAGPAQPGFPQNIEYTQYMPGSLHDKDTRLHLGPDRVADRLTSVALAMVDPASARNFYVGKLHFHPVANTSLLALPGPSGETVSLAPANLGPRASFTLFTSDLGRAREHLKRQSIPVDASAHVLGLRDPDGNLLELTDVSPLQSSHNSIQGIVSK